MRSIFLKRRQVSAPRRGDDERPTLLSNLPALRGAFPGSSVRLAIIPHMLQRAPGETENTAKNPSALIDRLIN